MKNIALLLVLSLLAGCSSAEKDRNLETPPPEKAPVNTEGLICPQVAILQQAQEAFDYGREKPSDAQLVGKAKLVGVSGDCAYRSGKEKSGIDISFSLKQVSMRGPRLGGDQLSFPYFVAVVDPADRILRRDTMTASFTFPRDKGVVEQEERLHVFIPVEGDALLAGPDYRVLMGFTHPNAGGAR